MVAPSRVEHLCVWHADIQNGINCCPRLRSEGEADCLSVCIVAVGSRAQLRMVSQPIPPIYARATNRPRRKAAFFSDAWPQLQTLTGTPAVPMLFSHMRRIIYERRRLRPAG